MALTKVIGATKTVLYVNVKLMLAVLTIWPAHTLGLSLKLDRDTHVDGCQPGHTMLPLSFLFPKLLHPVAPTITKKHF